MRDGRTSGDAAKTGAGRASGGRLELAIAAAGYALLTAAAFPGLATGRGTPAYHDLATHHLPWRLWTAERWLDGGLPLWNPLSANGFPMLAEPQVGALYPPNLLFGLVDPFVALVVSVLAHVWLAGFGAYLFGRALGFSRAGAALTGIGYGASGFLLTHVVYLPMLHGAAWLPLLLLAIDRFLRDGRARGALGAAGAAAAMVLAGHPQAAVLGALLAASYLAARIAFGYPGDEPPPRRLRVDRGWRLCLALGFAGLLVAPQLVATLELAGASERAGGVGAAFAAQGSLPPQELVHAVLPRTFGFERPADIPIAHHHHGELYWGNGETYWEDAFFLGVPGVLLALLALVAGARGVRLFAGWALLAPLLMLGPATPLFLLWRLVPGADLLRFPARFGLILTFAVAVLAGWALDAWLDAARARSARYRWATRVLIAVVALGWLGAALAHGALQRNEAGVREALTEYYDAKLTSWRALAADPPAGVDPAEIPPPPVGGEAPITVATTYSGDDFYGRKVDRIVAGLGRATAPFGAQVLLPVGMAVAVLALLPLAARRPGLRWAIVALAAADLLAFGSGFNPAVPWDEARAVPAAVDALRALDSPARPVRSAVVDRLQPLAVDRALMGASDHLRHGLAEVSIPSPLRVQSQYRLVALAGLGLEPMRLDERLARVVERADVVRALGVTHLLSAHALPAPYALVDEGEVRLYEVAEPWPRASLHGALPGDPEAGALGSPLRGLVVARDEPGAIDVELGDAGAGVVVLTETAYPGWRATLDGERAELATAGGALLAVEVPAGAQRLQLRYRPGRVRIALAGFPLVWALWTIWFIMAGASRRGRRR